LSLLPAPIQIDLAWAAYSQPSCERNPMLYESICSWRCRPSGL
jgi:hypothetical protein